MSSMSEALAALSATLLLLPGHSAAHRRLLGLGPARPPRPSIFRTLRAPRWTALASGVVVLALGGFPAGAVIAAPVAALAWWLTRGVLRRRSARIGGDEFMRIAASLDLLAACLRAGLPVQVAVRAVAAGAPATMAQALRSTADLLDLGADQSEAWAPVREYDAIAELARAAGRTARSGTALAEAAAELSTRLRDALGEKAEAKAQRAGVLITGPLGLCFLPAFLCLGVVPVVIGLASRLTIAT